jgi:hypothetical protein
MTPSSVLCAHDASFGAGLLEAMTQVSVDNTRCVLVAGDTGYPEPMNSVRPIYDAVGVALVLVREPTSRSIARLEVALSHDEATRLQDTVLEVLRLSVPAARSLPLLHVLTMSQPAKIVLDYLDNTRLLLEVTPC